MGEWGNGKWKKWEMEKQETGNAVHFFIGEIMVKYKVRYK